jgi:hypothetical protein
MKDDRVLRRLYYCTRMALMVMMGALILNWAIRRNVR